ncbi:hypothetical protein [Roseivirga seohaensis]|uniref:hypothetical protein n=1 Tax=Roseivirga seohaensis TaxID=1914963 RepID=UPI003BABD339
MSREERAAELKKNNTKDELIELILKLEEAPVVGESGAGKSTLGTVVIPFKQGPAAGNELQYAIRAWEAHYPALEQIIIIGDTPLFANDKLIVIEHKSESSNPQIDVAHKMAIAIASELVPDEFIWSNDDIYPVQNITEVDVRKVTYNGQLNSKHNGTLYSANRQATIKVLKEAGLDTLDYDTHTPFVFNKEGLAQMLDVYNCLNQGHLISSLFFNTLPYASSPVLVTDDKEGKGNYVVSVRRDGVTMAALKAAIENRKFLYHTDAGWPLVASYIKSKHLNKSSFEK